MAPRTLLVVLVPLLLASVAASSRARAQEPTASETALAREQYQDGMHFAQSGHWEQAFQAFSRAYGLVHRPALLANLASAEAQTGRLVEAAEHDRQFLREVTSGREAQQRPAVQAALDALDARIPRARFVPSDSRPTDVYTLDDDTLPRAAIGTPLPIDPGDHTLVVKADDVEIARARFTIHEGESTDVAIEVHRPVVDTHVHPIDTPDTHVVGEVGVHNDVPSPPPVSHDDGGVFASPVFWVIVGALAVAGGVVAAVLLTQGGREPFGGANLGTVTVQ